REVAVDAPADERSGKVDGRARAVPGEIDESEMPRTPERLVASLEHFAEFGCALEDLRSGEGVAGPGAQAADERNVAAQLRAACARQADVEVLRAKRAEAQRPRGDDVPVPIVEPREIDPHPIAGKPLLDSRVERAGALRLKIRIPEKTRIRAVGLQD